MYAASENNGMKRKAKKEQI
jgi:hypothetical protein